MKKLFFILAVVSLYFCFQIQATVSTPPWWAGKFDPNKDVIVDLGTETDQVIFDSNEEMLLRVSFSDPRGLNGRICLVATSTKIQACQILPSSIIGKTGAQAEFPILETVPGTYIFQAKFLNNGKMVLSNEVKITINPALPPFPPDNSVKIETAIIDGYEFQWKRTYANGIWGKPMPLGEPHPVFLAPTKKSNIIAWGSLKTEVGR